VNIVIVCVFSLVVVRKVCMVILLWLVIRILWNMGIFWVWDWGRV